MDPTEFWHSIDKHPGLRVTAVLDQEQEIVVQHIGFSSFAIPISCIKETDWEELEAILTEKRFPIVLHQMTRIVGYYSNTRQWNRSKLAELRDRRKVAHLQKLPASGKPIASLVRDPLPKEVADTVVQASSERVLCQVFSRNEKKN